MYYAVTHCYNSMETFNTFGEVEAFINEELEPYKDLNPKEIYRGYASGNNAEHPLQTLNSVIIWQFDTLYIEVFMIEQRGF